MKIDKNVLIIGASQGIGKALAEEYALAGANLVLLSRNLSAIEEISKTLNSQGHQCDFMQCDISIYEDVKKGIEFALNKLATIDLAIINAGVGNPEWMINFKSEGFKNSVSINTFGIAHSLEFLIPIMRKQGYGTIAGITTLSDVRGYPCSSSYCSSKAAASVLLESARVELKDYNINVITVRPGFVKTAMTDKNEFYMPFLMQTDKAAKIIMRGISKRKSLVQFPWFTVMLTRLAKIAPNFIFDPVMRMGRKADNK
ncbi:MAG: SDR family NAD(P)-dependent oxidoreductase [Ignavibacteriae bacterium]|nr:MAG: SDR family NAD(P)-dependent oxidoreductase [Ignavibacteriota bacterium]